MNSHSRHFMMVITSLLAWSLLSVTPVWASEQPKLVLQITVDALRGDLPERYAKVLGKGGFRYLMEKGVHYTNAHYQHNNGEGLKYL